MTSSTLARPRLSPRVRTVCRTRVRGIPPRYESSVAVSHSFEQRDLRFVRAAFEFYVHPLRSAVIFDHRLTRSRLHSFRRSVREREVRTRRTSLRQLRSLLRRGFARVNGNMKLDVSDVLYDSSSVSSDSGASQSSRVSHDFLSSIANTAVLPNNVSTDRNFSAICPASLSRLFSISLQDASRSKSRLVSTRCKCTRYVTHARQ